MLDLREGVFINEPPAHPHWAGNQLSFSVSQFLKAQQPEELEADPYEPRWEKIAAGYLPAVLCAACFGFGNLRSLPVLQEVLE